MGKKPLSEVRVVDFTWARAGPWATRWMAALGAEVIKVEWIQPATATFYGRGGAGVLTTTPQGVAPGLNSSGQMNDNHAGKLGLTLNVRDPRGLELTKRLIGLSDIVIENFSSRVMENWGLGYEEMAKIKPDIVYVSMAGLGHTGRDHEYTTMGPVVQALSGLTLLSGLPGKPPAGWGWSYMDDTGGMYGIMSALTALHHRNATGQGQHVDLAQVAAAITLTGPAILDKVVNGRSSRREGYPPGNRTVWPGAPLINNYRGRTTAPHNSYRTLGGGYNDWCVISCFSDREWRSLVDVMGSPAWANEDRFSTLAGRIEHQGELDGNIEAWTVTLEKYELMDRCQQAGVPAAAVQSNEDRVDHDPQLRHQQMYRPVHHAVLGTNLMQNFPFTLSETEVLVEKPAPLVGEHTRQILAGLLGVTQEELKAGFEQGIYWPKSIPMEDYIKEQMEAATPLPVMGASGETAAVLPSEQARPRYTAGPLGDLRILELGGQRAQWAGKLLADLGADVIKIEPPGGGAEREIGPFYHDRPHPERSLHFWHYNTSKRGVTLDLETEDGRAVFRKLVATADVVLETFRPGYLPSLGLGYERLKAINPRLIMCSLTDFGQTGPWRDYLGTDLVHLAAGGQMASCGYYEKDDPDLTPIAPGGGNSWHIGGHYAYIAILGALAFRDFNGKGQYIDASIHGACALTTEGAVSTWIYSKQVVKRNTGQHASAQPVPPSQYPTKDGRYVNVSGGILRLSSALFKVYVDWMNEYGLAEDLTDPKYQDPKALQENQAHIVQVLEHFFASLTAEEIYRGAQARGFPTGVVRAAEETLDDPHWHDRGFFVEVEHPEVGEKFTYPGVAAIYNASPGRIYRRAPLVGEHNEEVFGALGLDRTEMAVLREGGVI